jgi:cytochrome o ubiquinol oxidase operon protein cyoD
MTGEHHRADAAHDEDDVAPGFGSERESPLAQIASYAIGLVLSVALTAAAFWLPGTDLIWPPAIPVALLVLAVAQIGVHLVFFLHITTAPDNTNNVLALGFGILVVVMIVAGSLWIMDHLNENMMPASEVMRMQR